MWRANNRLKDRYFENGMTGLVAVDQLLRVSQFVCACDVRRCRNVVTLFKAVSFLELSVVSLLFFLFPVFRVLSG